MLHQGIANITSTLKAKGIFEDTLIIFSTDNGGQTNAGEFAI